MSEPSRAAGESGSDQPTPGPFFDGDFTRLQGEKPTAASAQPPRTEDNFSTDELFDDLSFLAPPVGEGMIGRIGNYDVFHVVGRGGMGIVFKAFDESLHRTVAIKVLQPRLAASQRFHRRFLQEARSAASVSHPNVVTIHAVGEHRSLPFLVMEFIRGRTLRERIREQPAPDVRDLLRIGVQIASGLGAAHSHGLIHRDIKPLNILLEDDIERVKIADFGLARAALETSDLTSLGAVVGTPAYMSPEQVSRGEVDVRSDLFSLGCVLYAIAMGHSPFEGKDVLEIISKIGNLTPSPLCKIAPHIPLSVSQVVSKLLEKNPTHRYQSAKEVADALSSLLAACQDRSTAELHLALNAAPVARKGKRRLTLGLGALILLPLMGWGLWNVPHLLKPPSKDEQSQPQPDPLQFQPDQNVTVSQSGDVDYRTLGEALLHIGPRSTIRILDSETYNEAIEIADPERLTELTIEAAGGQSPTLSASGGRHPAVITVRDTAGVKLMGLTIDVGSKQNAVWIGGNVPGLRLELLHCREKQKSDLALIKLHGAAGDADNPVVISHCDIESLNGQCLWTDGDPEHPVANVNITDNRLFSSDQGSLVVFWRDTRNVTFQGNTLTGGGIGVNLNFDPPHRGENLSIVNNTFFRSPFWLGFVQTTPGQCKHLEIVNNLILETREIQTFETKAEEFGGHPEWVFSHNFWDPGTMTVDTHGLAALVHSVELVSRDRAHKDFLRPVRESPLGKKGAGGEFPGHVGAFPPTE